MSKGLFGGMTDYSHQSFDDILNDIESERKNAEVFVSSIRSKVHLLELNGYWKNSVSMDFKLEVEYALKHYATAISEFSDISKDLVIEVRANHIKRLKRISDVAQKINISIGKVWHQEYHNKEYGNPDFVIVEHIYEETRDMAVNLLDTSNIAERLRDFIGKRKQPEKKRFTLELGHKISLGSLIVAVLVLLFGNNVCNRMKKNNTMDGAAAKTDSMNSFSPHLTYQRSLAENDSILKTIIDTPINELPGLKNELQRPEKPQPKRGKKNHIKDKKESNINNGINYGTIGGTNNTVNNQFGLVPRKEMKEIIAEVHKQVSDKTAPVSIFRRGNDAESFAFANKIVKALKDVGYSNAFVNGIVSDAIIGGDPDEAMRHQASISYSWGFGQFNITIPTNQ